MPTLSNDCVDNAAVLFYPLGAYVLGQLLFLVNKGSPPLTFATINGRPSTGNVCTSSSTPGQRLQANIKNNVGSRHEC